MTGSRPALRVVLATFGSPGDVRPFLAIGSELRARGYDPVVATSPFYRGMVIDAELGFAAVRPDRVPGQQDPDFVDRLLRERRSPKSVAQSMFLPSLRESVHDLLRATEDSVAIVSHTLTPAARLVAEVRHVPWVSTVMQPMGYVSAYEPPVVLSAGASAALRATGPGPTSGVLRVARWLTAAWMSEWHELRAELDLPRVRDHPLWEGQHSPRRSIGLFPSILGPPQPDWPRQARVTGFPFFRGPDRRLDPEVENFMTAGEPSIVFTLGTTAVNDPGLFYEESAEAARRLGYRAVLLVGQGEAGMSSRPAADVLAIPHAPHDLVFPRAAAVVHQGGIGTLSEVLLAGKPMLIMPYGHDQADNAWRASRLGVARVIPRWRYRARYVSRALDRILNDPEMQQSAKDAARAVAHDGGARCAAELIETVLNERSR